MESVTKPPRGRRYALSGETALKGYSSHMKKKKGGHTKKRTSLLHGFKDYDVDVSAHIFL